jgi:hypothetical protein
VTRQATRASANDSSTATAVCQYGMAKVAWPSHASPARPITCPPMNQDEGVSMAASGSCSPRRPPSMAPRSVKARRADRQCRVKESRLEVTMQATPPQSVQGTMAA